MNTKVIAKINQGLRVEHVGEEIVLLDSVGLVVHTLTGDAARCFDLVANGRTETEVSPALETLVAAGLVTITDGTGKTAVSRRKALAYGAAGAGVVAASLSSMALPAAAGSATTFYGTTTTAPPIVTTTTIPGTPNVAARFGTTRSNVAPFTYTVNASWRDRTVSPIVNYDFSYTVKKKSGSGLAAPGSTLFSGTSASGAFEEDLTDWETEADLVVTIELTSLVGGVVQSDDKTRP